MRLSDTHFSSCDLFHVIDPKIFLCHCHAKRNGVAGLKIRNFLWIARNERHRHRWHETGIFSCWICLLSRGPNRMALAGWFSRKERSCGEHRANPRRLSNRASYENCSSGIWANCSFRSHPDSSGSIIVTFGVTRTVQIRAARSQHVAAATKWIVRALGATSAT